MKGIVGLLWLLCSLQAGLCITCYSCNNDPNSSGPYDPNCDTDGYDGTVVNNNVHQTCYTNIYDDGSLYRGVDTDEHEDGTCSHYGSYTMCFCASDKCNNNLCADCGGNPTMSVPITTPEPTTEVPSTTNKFTTVEPTDPPTTEPQTTGPATTNPPITTDPVTTNPPITDSPTTEPQTTNPPTTDPPTTDPPTTNPPITDPPTTDSATTNPPITDPPTTDPPTTDPPTTNPPITDPPTTDPPTTDAPTTQPPITTEIETTTTTAPVIQLACYDCQNTEPAYDNYDEDCGADGYAGMTYTCNNCFSCTVQVHDDGKIFRGEAGAFGDGECASGIDVEDGGNYVTCYCTSDLCNDKLCQHCDPPQKH